MSFDSVKLLNVFWQHGGGNIPLGSLALQGRSIYFEYYEKFIDLDIQISPFKLHAQEAGVTSSLSVLTDCKRYTPE